MPRPVQFYLCAAVLLLANAALATPAHTEMTEADKEGMRAFAACLDENGGDEEDCVGKLGRYAWYPRDDAACEAVASRIDEILDVGGDPIWKDVFQNERCARLELFFSTKALPDKQTGESGLQTIDCRNAKPASLCYNMHGRHLWNPIGATLLCEMVASGLMKYPALIPTKWWDSWFRNERCQRLDLSYFDAAAGVVHEAPLETNQ